MLCSLSYSLGLDIYLQTYTNTSVYIRMLSVFLSMATLQSTCVDLFVNK